MEKDNGIEMEKERLGLKWRKKKCVDEMEKEKVELNGEIEHVEIEKERERD